MGQLAERIDRLGGWETSHRARGLLERLGVTAWEQSVAELSGGTRKRVAIARALLTEPDLLLLDEPTNHLDADTVDWLEEALDAFQGSLLLVTHDRYFLDDLVDRILEIQPGGGVSSFPGNYEAYLLQKLEAEANASVAEHKRQRWIAQEVAWLRRGVEARRTKSKARIQRARSLMAQKTWASPQVAQLKIAPAPRLGHTVLELEHIGKSFEGRVVLKDVSFLLQRGERVGIVGPNGVGKTTFLRVLLGELAADTGSLTIGKNTVAAYYDQQRAKLDPLQTVYQAAAQDGSAAGSTGSGDGQGEQIEIGGQRIELRDYLEDLLFPIPMQRQQVSTLSGGERNRLLLAKLFLTGANLLVLDEPTNDLDLVTLNVLERLLLGFQGSVLLVTHDRYFLDKVATSVLAFEGQGRVVRYPGNYETYRSLRPLETTRTLKPDSGRASSQAARPVTVRRPGKLTFKEQRELEGMEAAILTAEARLRSAEAALGDPLTYKAPELLRGGESATRIAELKAALLSATAEIERLYARWQELQSLRDAV